MNFVPKVKIEILLADDQVDEVVKVLTKAATTGKVGDGKIAVLPVDNVLRIRTGEQGDDAL